LLLVGGAGRRGDPGRTGPRGDAGGVGLAIDPGAVAAAGVAAVTALPEVGGGHHPQPADRIPVAGVAAADRGLVERQDPVVAGRVGRQPPGVGPEELLGQRLGIGDGHVKSCRVSQTMPARAATPTATRATARTAARRRRERVPTAWRACARRTSGWTTPRARRQTTIAITTAAARASSAFMTLRVKAGQ